MIFKIRALRPQLSKEKRGRASTLEIIKSEKPSIEDIISKASASSWEDDKLIGITWEQPLTFKEYQIFLEHFPQFHRPKKPKTCGECDSRKRWMCALDGGGLCPDHQDIKDIQDAWKVTNVVFTACLNFKPKEEK